MKKLSTSSFTLATILSVASIILIYGASSANELSDTSFHALNKVAIEEQVGIAPMTDDQLASIEGGRKWRGGGSSTNVAAVVVVANNICVLCKNVNQKIVTNANIVQLNLSGLPRR